jgi:hypothetical protein
VEPGSVLDTVEKRNISYLCQGSKPNSSAVQPIAIPTELSSLPTPSYDYKLQVGLCGNTVLTKGDGLSNE